MVVTKDVPDDGFGNFRDCSTFLGSDPDRACRWCSSAETAGRRLSSGRSSSEAIKLLHLQC